MIKQEKLKSKQELILTNAPIIINEDNANNFLLVMADVFKWGLAWNGSSDMKFELFEEFNLAVFGFSERTLAFNLLTGTLQLSLSLGFPFMFFQKTNLGFVIVSELTVIGINGYDCSIRKFIVSPDIIQDLEIVGDKYTIHGLGDSFTR